MSRRGDGGGRPGRGRAADGPESAALAPRAAGPSALLAVLTVAVVAVAGVGPAASTAAAAPTLRADTTHEEGRARRVLRRAAERYRSLRSLRATFRESVRVPLLERERSGRGTWYQKGRGLFKLDYTEPPEDVIVSDGTHVWTYYPSSQPGQATRTALERSSRGREIVDLMGRIFREARQGYRARYAGRGEVAGVPVHHVVLTSVGEATYREVELWIGTDDRLVRKFRVVEENRTVRVVTLTDLEPDAAIADSVFRFDVPEGVEVFSG